MGRVTAEFVLSNYADLVQVRLGTLTADKVRRTTLTGTVDTGATRLTLPESVVRQLGLAVTGRTVVKYADQRTATRDVVGDAHVALAGREGVFKALVEPSRTDALIGAIVMEDLDLIVDCPGRQVAPRDPNMLLTEIG